jgi:hypothetical protein
MQMIDEQSESARHSTLRRLSWIAAICGIWYALYRAMYALGSTWMLPGTVVETDTFRFIN